MLIAERWELGPNINSGGFAHVHRGFDLTGGPDVAIKLLHSQNSEAAKRMRYTAELVSKLEHPGIVPILDVAEYEHVGQRHPALVMELVPGGRTLRHVIQQLAPMEVPDAAEIMIALVDAVAHAHEGGIIHRDLKPENVLEDGTTGMPRLIDFDLGKVTAQNVTMVQVQMGTPPYAPPELRNAVTATRASDYYSLGVIFHELLTGTQSWCTSDDSAWRAPSTENPESSPACDDLVRRLIRRDPRERLSDADELAAALATLG